MKITISSSTFNSQLQIASRVLQKKNPMPILDAFLFEVYDGVMRITASNAVNSIITCVPIIEQQGEGRFCINANTLLNTIKEIPEQPLVLEYDESTNNLRGSHECGDFSVMGLDAEMFPPCVPVHGGSEITISSKELVDGVNNCIVATTDDEIMLFKRGIYFDVRDDRLIMVATDGRKLVRKMLRNVNPGITGSFIIPRSIAGILKSIAKKNIPATIAFDQQRATITIDDTMIYFRLVETRYPDYDSVIPKNVAICVTMERLALIGALKRVGVFCNQSNNFVKLELSNNQAVFTGSDVNFSTSAKEYVPCDYDGAPFSIGFGYTFFVEILNSIEDDNVRLELLSSDRPCICKPAEENDSANLLMLLMPMKIEG